MLRILSAKKRNEFYRKMIGKELEVLFEHQNHNGFMKGFASNYVRVQKEYGESYVNKFSAMIIDEVQDNICLIKNSVDKNYTCKITV